MAYGGGMYGGGFGFSPQEQALTYGQKRYMRGRPSLSQQAELMGGYAIPLYAAQEQQKEQQQYIDMQRAWYDEQAGMIDKQIGEYKRQGELGRISEQEMFKQTSALEKQLSENRMEMERGIAERQLSQQKTQGQVAMGLQAAQTGLSAAQYGPKLWNWLTKGSKGTPEVQSEAARASLEKMGYNRTQMGQISKGIDPGGPRMGPGSSPMAPSMTQAYGGMPMPSGGQWGPPAGVGASAGAGTAAGGGMGMMTGGLGGAYGAGAYGGSLGGGGGAGWGAAGAGAGGFSMAAAGGAALPLMIPTIGSYLKKYDVGKKVLGKDTWYGVGGHVRKALSWF